jgi:hypothetical protein
LCDGTIDDVRAFVVAVVDLAGEDHRIGRRKGRTGIEITRMICGPSRLFHEAMATGIYNKTRDTLRRMGT